LKAYFVVFLVLHFS